MLLATKFKPDADEPFRTALDAGLRAAELWTGPDVLDDWRVIAARALRHDLQYVLHFPTRRDLTDAHLRNFIELRRALGVQVAVIHELEHDRYGTRMAELDPELDLAVENGGLSLDGFAAWEVSYARLTLDAEHVWLFTHQGAERAAAVDAVRAFLRRSVDKLRHVHLPGYDGGRAEHRPMYQAPEFAAAVLTLLYEAGYCGQVVSEVNVEFQTFEHLRRDVEFFAAWRQNCVKQPRVYTRG